MATHTTTKYELYIKNQFKKSIVSSWINREVIIKELIQIAIPYSYPYKIFITEDNGERQLYIVSFLNPHKEFIEALIEY